MRENERHTPILFLQPVPRPFPDRFDPYDWPGPRARAHRQREDAFQQLVGQAVQETLGLRAHVAATAGRDGSIDIYVEDDAAGERAFQGWPLPLILECKDHDEGGRDLAKNIQTGWRTVREKLARQAAAGWPGAFAPWTGARAYLYCLSSRLPSQAARDDLRDEILEFFRSLPAESRPPLAAVAVLDWSDLRGWLDRLPRVADAWLGTEVPSIVGHEEFLASLVGFRRYLLPEELPYVAPEPDAATHPDRLFERLVEDDSPGVLLVGVGGVGKTRLAVEVASRAVAAGWRVLHAGAGDSALEVDALAAVVFAQGSRTLVVLDYLDQMHRLDPGALRHRFLPEARRRGQEVALLAMARPGAAVLDHPEWGSLLARVDLTPTRDQVEAIAEEMLASLAPRAEAVLGKERLRQLCGRRPILTLFLARELERRAHEGLLSAEQVADLREGDLLRWLRLRLEENGIMVPVAHRLLPPDPEDAVVAAAAVLAAAPSSRAELTAAAAAALGERSDQAQPLVDNLAAFGWLEPAPGEWSTAHDVVADEVLEQVLRPRPGTSVRSRALQLFLSAGLRAPRTLGRFALALRRLILASADEPEFAENLTRAARDWLRRVEAELAWTLAAADPDIAGYALGSVIAGPPWDEPAFERWDALIGPWLDRWKGERAARHLLYIGLRRRKSVSVPLVEHALAWLRIHGHELEASFVFSQLFKRAEAGPEAVNFGLEWLARFPLEKESAFVLSSLLGRVDLGVRAAEATGRCLVWLARFSLEKETGFVLYPLLCRLDLGERATEAIDWSLAWLARFPLEKESRFILSSLLDRPDLGKRAVESIDRGLAWLERFPLEKEANFVLSSLLERSDLGERAAELIDLGLAWLVRFPAEKEGKHVFSALLSRSDLGEKTTESINQGLGWLERFPLEKEAGFILFALLGRRDLGERAAEAIDRGLAWLERFPLEKEANFVLSSLLDRPDLGKRAAEAIDRGLTWLARFPLDKETDFVLSVLHKREDLRPEQKKLIASLALDWLAHNPLDSSESSFLLRRVLSVRGLTPAEEIRTVQLGLAWCDLHPSSPEADFVLKPILRRKRLSDEDWSQAVLHAFTWLRKTPHKPDRDHLLVSCLSRPRLLPGPELDFLVRDTLAWCQEFPSAKGSVENLRRFLRRAARGTPWERDSSLFPTLGTAALRQWLENPAEGPQDELLAREIARVGEILDGGRSKSSPYYLSLLLPLTTRWGTPAQQVQVIDLTRRMLADPAFETRQRAGFASACFQFLEGGAWPDAEAGRKILHELGLTDVELMAPPPRPKKIPLVRTVDLFEWAEHPLTGPREELLTAGITQARELLSAGGLGSAGYHLIPLLPLAARWGSEAQRAEVRELARGLLSHPQLKPGQRRDFVRGCRRLLDRGVWPDVQSGRKLLSVLGVIEAGQSSDPRPILPLNASQ